ncbi:hypothetical protein DPMN_064242 [Dreissena polymorpha]|uniref:Uncharacterized protein n=1 Tax=Dreissena polymorpha TaxID=45954 RepID=A0A9D4CD01_DREPO|nr:hypothetical protein DPMN_064242 [Dreissena polymorpha]
MWTRQSITSNNPRDQVKKRFDPTIRYFWPPGIEPTTSRVPGIEPTTSRVQGIKPTTSRVAVGSDIISLYRMRLASIRIAVPTEIHFQDMAPDGRKDGRTNNAKTISLRLWRGITT